MVTSSASRQRIYRNPTNERHGSSILELQQQIRALLHRVEALERSNEELKRANDDLALEFMAEHITTEYYRHLCVALFTCSVIFNIMTIIVLGIIIYNPAAIYSIAILGFFIAILVLGILVFLHEFV